MTEATTAFFETVDQRGYDPRLALVAGRVRFDLKQDDRTDSWLVAIDHGKISVSRQRASDVDSVVAISAETFERSARGEESLIAALFRGSMHVDGNLRLAMMVERLLPGPPNARGPRCLWQKEEGGRA